MKIKNIIDKIDEKQLFVPSFQREYRWQRSDALKLVDSLLKEYPTGTLLVWETNKPPELKGPHKYDEKQGAVKILLDGQQRVTTLYILSRNKAPPYYLQSEILVDPAGMWIDVISLKVDYGNDARRSAEPRWQKITDILQGGINAWKLFEAFAHAGQPLNDTIKQAVGENIDIIRRIMDYDIPEQTIPIRASVKEAIEIFYIVNKAGITLTDAELALAQISGYWPSARREFKEKLQKLETRGFDLSLDLLVYMILACIYSSGTELHRLHSEDNELKVKECWNKLSDHILDRALSIIQDYAFVDHSSELSTPYVLVPLVSWLYRLPGNPSETQIKKMTRWFYLAQARQRYSVGVLQKLETELKIIEKNNDPWSQLIGFIAERRPLQISPEELSGVGIQSPFFTVMRWVFKARLSVCLTSGATLHIGMGEKYLLNRDHIFPSRMLRKHGFGQNDNSKYGLAQEIANRVIVREVAARPKIDAEPALYLSESKNLYPSALWCQCIPEDPGLWNVNRYSDFLKERRRLIADALNEYIQGLENEPVAPLAVSVEELIQAGESEELEFKQTFRWDVAKGEKSKKIEEAVAKAVGAFANSDGGTLLIGVHDTAGVVGLESDFAVCGGDRDGFELALTTSLQNQYGAAFKASKVKIQFPLSSTRIPICRVDVTRNDKLVSTTFSTQNGPVKKIYVRSGNSSQELPVNEIESYINLRG